MLETLTDLPRRDPRARRAPSFFQDGRVEQTSRPLLSSARLSFGSATMDDWRLVPSHKLALCRIQKNMNTVLCDLFCSLNKKQHDGGRHVRGVFDFENGCEWDSASAAYLGIANWQVRSHLRDSRWTKAIFYRDPLSRFLSAFLSKCTDDHDGEWNQEHICKPLFGSRTPSFSHAAQVVAADNYHMPTGLAGNHWRLQMDFCESFRDYDVTFLITRSTVGADVATMMEAAGYANPSAEYAYHYHFPDGRRALDEHETNADSQQLEYYTEPILRNVLKYLAPDYAHLQTVIGHFVPEWAVQRVGVDYIYSLGLGLQGPPTAPPPPPLAPPTVPPLLPLPAPPPPLAPPTVPPLLPLPAPPPPLAPPTVPPLLPLPAPPAPPLPPSQTPFFPPADPPVTPPPSPPPTPPPQVVLPEPEPPAPSSLPRPTAPPLPSPLPPSPPQIPSPTPPPQLPPEPRALPAVPPALPSPAPPQPMLLIVGAALALATLGLAARRALVFCCCRAHKPPTNPTHQATLHGEPHGRQAKASSAAAAPSSMRSRVAGVLKRKSAYRQFDDDVDESSACVRDDVTEEGLDGSIGPAHIRAPAMGRTPAQANGDRPSSSAPAAGEEEFAPREKRTSYRPDVDGLRAVAVVSVIAFHLDKSWLPGGFVGVDIFFVISGFVVLGSLLRGGPAGSAWQFLAAFYSRRIKRLTPALVATVAFTAAALSAVVPPEVEGLRDYYLSGQLALIGCAVRAEHRTRAADAATATRLRRCVPHHRFPSTPRHALARLCLLCSPAAPRLRPAYTSLPPRCQNLQFATMANGYWEQGLQTLEYNPFTHMWSLGVEEQFYFVCARLTSRTPLALSPSRPRDLWPSRLRCRPHPHPRAITPTLTLTLTLTLSLIALSPSLYALTLSCCCCDARSFPALVVLAYGPRVSRTSPQSAWCIRRRPVYLMALSCVLSLALSSWLSESSQRYAFYLLPSRFWQLMIGAIIFEWQDAPVAPNGGRPAAPLPPLRKALVALLEVCICTCAWLAFTRTEGDRHFPVPWSLLAIAAAVGYIGLGSFPQQHWRCGLPCPLLNAVIGWGPVAYIGRLSYPLCAPSGVPNPWLRPRLLPTPSAAPRAYATHACQPYRVPIVLPSPYDVLCLCRVELCPRRVY